MLALHQPVPNQSGSTVVLYTVVNVLVLKSEIRKQTALLEILSDMPAA